MAYAVAAAVAAVGVQYDNDDDYGRDDAVRSDVFETVD